MKRSAGPFLTLAAALLLLRGCAPEPKGTVIAKVGDAELTLEEAKTSLDTLAPDYAHRLRQHVAAWVNAELLHQEALRLGIEDDPAFAERVASVRRQLANQEVLDRLVYGDTAVPDEGTLRSYLAAHPDEFMIREVHLKLRLATFRGRESAGRFARSAAAASDWSAALDSMGRDPRLGGEVITSVPGKWYTRSTIFPAELWKVAGTLSAGEVSFPVKAGEGYTVMQFLASAPPGKTTEFEVVREDVRSRVLIERRRAAFEALLGTLRERYGVEVSMNNPVSAPEQ
jgi:hypothetical protein